eukprot:4017104-Prymnesium_polylepis.1
MPYAIGAEKSPHDSTARRGKAVVASRGAGRLQHKPQARAVRRLHTTPPAPSVRGGTDQSTPPAVDQCDVQSPEATG